MFLTKRMVGSTSNSINIVHEPMDDNCNHSMNMIIDAMRMNKGCVNQCLIVEEESNADATIFFYLLKYYDELLWDGCTNHSKLLVIAQVFTIKSNHVLSEAGYNRIIEWAKNILPERNRLEKKTFMLLNL